VRRGISRGRIDGPERLFVALAGRRSVARGSSRSPAGNCANWRTANRARSFLKRSAFGDALFPKSSLLVTRFFWWPAPWCLEFSSWSLLLAGSMHSSARCVGRLRRDCPARSQAPPLRWTAVCVASLGQKIRGALAQCGLAEAPSQWPRSVPPRGAGRRRRGRRARRAGRGRRAGRS